MNKILLVLLFSVFTMGTGIAQSLEDDFEFKYIKAKYLLDKEKYEDAIVAFTVVIKEQEGYLDALVLRAQAKYAMAAFKGTKKDILRYTELRGMTAKSAMLLGKAEYKLGNNEAATNSLELAGLASLEDAQIFEFLGNMYKEDGKEQDACNAWSKAAAMGSSKARTSMRKTCKSMEEPDEVSGGPRKTSKLDPAGLPTKGNMGDVSPKPKADEEDDDRTPEQKRRDEDDSLNSPTKGSKKNDDKSDDAKSDDMKSDDKPSKSDKTNDDDDRPSKSDRDYDDYPPDDNTPNEIEIDEDLTLVIKGQGLGKRRVLDQPNILILADEDGIVAIDICVNKRGKVETAEFNTKQSTLAKKSLVSLAIRKAKDFWFEKNDYKEQCGVILFKLKES